MKARCPYKPQACNWCGRPLGEDEECWLARGGLKEGVELPKEEEGPFISLYLSTAHKEVVALLRSPNCDAKKDCIDFTIAACSEACASKLTVALKDDRGGVKVI